MKFKLNLNDFGGFDPIPAGDYKAYLYDVQAKTFSTGSQGFTLTFKIAEGPHQGRQVYDNLVLVKNAYWKLAQFWKAMTNETGEVEIDTELIPTFVGRKVGLKVDVETTDQGNTRNVVKNMYYVGGQEPVEAETLSGVLAGGEVEPLNITEDDLPF